MAVLCACAAGGCSQSPYELAQVSGTVTIDGVPFAQGKVMFAPVAKGESRRAGRPALGRLQNDGSFTLGTYQENDGAVVGDHWVTIIRLEDDAATGPKSAAPPFGRLLVPTKSTVVAGQENHIDVRLTKADVLKYGEDVD